VQRLNGFKYQNAWITEIFTILLITWVSCPLRDDYSFQEESQAAQRSHHSCTVHHPGAGPWHPLDVTSVPSSPALSVLSQILSHHPWSLLSSKSLFICMSPTVPLRATSHLSPQDPLPQMPPQESLITWFSLSLE